MSGALMGWVAAIAVIIAIGWILQGLLVAVGSILYTLLRAIGWVLIRVIAIFVLLGMALWELITKRKVSNGQGS